MNKRTLLGVFISLFLLTACSNNNRVTSIDDPSITGEGGVSFTFSSSTKTKSTASVQYKAVGDSFPEPTNVRVLVRRYSGSELVFNTLGDVQVPTDTTLVLTVPVGSNYQIDAFSYVDSTNTYKYILKHDQLTNIPVVADSITQVSLTLEGIYPTYSLPDSVDKGDQIFVAVDFDKFLKAPSRLQSLSYLKKDTLYSESLMRSIPGAINRTYYGSDYYAGWELSESEFDGRYVYFSTNFVLSQDDYYKSNESKFSFVYNYPNPFIESDTLKTYIKTPEGGIGVDVTY